MLEKMGPSVRESFEIEAPSAFSAFEIEDPRATLTNAAPRTKQKLTARFIVQIIAGVVIGTTAVCVCYYLNSENPRDATITPLDIDASLLQKDISYGSLKLLRNGMRIVLGSTDRTPFAHVSLCLGIGYFSEPKKLAGLMHVLAGALMNGSKKYPGQHDWSHYLDTNQGTSMRMFRVRETHTCYYFKVNHTSLDGAIHRFVDALKNPLFQKDVVQKINTDPEFWNRVYKGSVHNRIDRNSRMAIWFDDMNPDHQQHYPLGPVDNLKTDDAGSKLHSFFKQYVSAQDMTLAVVAPQPLADLVPLVSPFNMLRGTPDREHTPRGPRYGDKEVPPFLPGHFAGLIYRVTPNSLFGLSRSIELSWLLSDCQKSKWREKPWLYAVHTLRWAGGSGGIGQFFREKGWMQKDWISGFSVWKVDEGTYCVLVVRIDVTKEGMNHIPEIGAVVFEYLRFLRTVPRNTILDWLQGRQRLMDLNFKYSDKYEHWYGYMRRYVDHMWQLSHGLLVYPEKYVLSASKRLFETDTEAQLQFLSELTVDSVRVMVTALEYNDTCTQKSKHFGVVRYFKTQLTRDMLNAWKGADNPPEFQRTPEWMRLPPKNPFLPVDFSLVTSSPLAGDHISVQVLPPKSMVRVFSLTNTQHRIPKVLSLVRIFSDILFFAGHGREVEDIADSAFNEVRILTWVEALRMTVRQNLSSLHDIAPWAGLDVGVDVSSGCVEILVHAPTSLVPVLIRNVAKQIMSLEELPADDEMFKIAYEHVKKKLMRVLPPYSPYRNIGFFPIVRLMDYGDMWWADDEDDDDDAAHWMEMMLRGKTAMHEQRLGALQILEKKGLKAEPGWMLQRSAIEVLLVGNVLPRQAEEWSQILSQELRLQESADLLTRLHQVGTCRLPRGTTLWRMPRPLEYGEYDSTENGAAMYIQFESVGEANDDEGDVALDLFLHIARMYSAKPPVGSVMQPPPPNNAYSYGSHVLVVWEPETPYAPDAILRIFHNWLGKLAQWVMGLNETTFTEIRDKYLSLFSQPPRILEDLYLPIVHDFRSRRFTFDFMLRTRKILSNFNSFKFVQLMERHFGTCRKLCMQLTRTDGQENEDLEAGLKKLAETDSSLTDLTFDRTWDGPEVPSPFKDTALRSIRHLDFTESVPASIDVSS